MMSGTNANEHQLYGTNFGLRAQEPGVDQGPVTGISTPNCSLGGTNSCFGLDEVISDSIHPTGALAKGTLPVFEIEAGDSMVINNALHQQQERSSAIAVPQNLPPFAGELERVFEAPNPEQPGLFNVSQIALQTKQSLQLGNMQIGPNYGGSFPVAPPAAQGTVTSLSNTGNYHLPVASNLTPQLHGGSSSNVQLPPIQEPSPQNPLGAAEPCFLTAQWNNNPNLQQPYSQLSTGQGATPEMMQSGGVSSFYSDGRSSNIESHSSNIQQQQGLMSDIHPIPNPHEIGASLSRNFGMKLILPDDSQQSTDQLQASSLLNPTVAQGSGNPHPTRPVRNSLYDPVYEQMGVPLDPHLRLFQAEKHRQGNA